jgi:hypothetical protein
LISDCCIWEKNKIGRKNNLCAHRFPGGDIFFDSKKIKNKKIYPIKISRRRLISAKRHKNLSNNIVTKKKAL